MRDRRILITGAAGGVGANLTRWLLSSGCQVDAVLRPGSAAWRLQDIDHPGLSRHEADVCEPEQLAAVFDRVRPEIVFHLAVARGQDEAARERMLRMCSTGALAIIRCAGRHAVHRLVIAGSSTEYGPSDSPLGEQHQLAPTTWNGATKAAAGLLFRQAAQENGLPAVQLRLFHVYGPWESAHRLAPTAIRAALSGQPMSLTEPGIRRDWVYVDDVCQALLQAADSGRPGEIFNIGSGSETSNEALVKQVEHVTGRPILIEPTVLPRRPTDAAHRLANISLARERLGWTPRTTLSEGLRRMVDWHRQHPAAWSHASDHRPATM